MIFFRSALFDILEPPNKVNHDVLEPISEINRDVLDTLKQTSKVDHNVSLYPNVVFVKTHKTGSTTVQNILLRYADQHNLFVGLPLNGRNVFYKKDGSKFHKSYVQPSNHEINILCHHMRFDEEQVASVMPKHTKYVTILREPGSCFASIFEYCRSSSAFKMVPATQQGFEMWLNNPDRCVVFNDVAYFNCLFRRISQF